MGWLDNFDLPDLNIFEKVEGLRGEWFGFGIGNDPLNNDAGINDPRGHGRPFRRTARITELRTGFAVFHNSKSRAITVARLAFFFCSSTAWRIRLDRTALFVRAFEGFVKSLFDVRGDAEVDRSHSCTPLLKISTIW